MPVTIHAHEEPRATISLEREPEAEDSEQQLADEMLGAIQTLASGWIEPLALHLSVGCYDTETFHAPGDCELPRPQWFLLKEILPPGVTASPVYVNPVSDTAPELTEDRIRAWVSHAMAQECPDAPRYVTSWRELIWPAVRVRLPQVAHPADGACLSVSCYAGIVSVTFERVGTEAWVSGPIERYGFGPPITLTARNHDGAIGIDIEVYWDLWNIEPAGRAQVDAAVDRVLALGRGWQRSES